MARTLAFERYTYKNNNNIFETLDVYNEHNEININKMPCKLSSGHFLNSKSEPTTNTEIKENEEKEEEEELLRENEDRFVLFPIKHHDIWKAYKEHMGSFWTAEEIHLSEDIKDWKFKMNEDERYFIKHVIGFFVASDGIVIENISTNLLTSVQLPEARCFYSYQMFNESIHSEVYSILIDTFAENEEEKTKLFSAVKHFPAIKKKADWAQKWIKFGKENKNGFEECLVAFAAVEGIFFSGSFCSLFWIKKRGLLPGLTFSNEQISKDEAKHTQFACLLYKKLKKKLPKERVLEIITGAVEIEKEFNAESLPVDLIGMNSELMKQYIEFVSDVLLIQLGIGKHYGTPNPFPWMNNIDLERKTNFFERTVAEYARPNIYTDGKEKIIEKRGILSCLNQKQEKHEKHDEHQNKRQKTPSCSDGFGMHMEFAIDV